jgi:hypothetical protein
VSVLGTPVLIGNGLIRGALMGIGELVDLVVKPRPDGLARPTVASITIYSSARSERQY